MEPKPPFPSLFTCPPLPLFFSAHSQLRAGALDKFLRARASSSNTADVIRLTDKSTPPGAAAESSYRPHRPWDLRQRSRVTPGGKEHGARTAASSSSPKIGGAR